MKNIFFFLFVLLFAVAPAQQKMKDYKHILKSKSIYEIDAFLKDAHPDDPRRAVLKPRLMGMIKEYIKKAHPKDQRLKEMQEKLALLRRRPHTKISFEEMNEIIKQKQIAKYKQELNERQSGFTRNTTGGGASTAAAIAMNTAAFSSDAEEAEFKMLMNTSPEEHKRKTVHILNKLFDNDPSSDETIVLVNNKSSCNIIVRIEGANNLTYRLPVPTQQENSIVVKKGDYIFSSLVCGAQYASQKTLDKSIMVALDNPKK